MNNTDFISGFVDILGDSVTMHFCGSVDIVNEPSIAEEVLVTNINNPPKVLNGILNDQDGSVARARVSCLKNNIVVDYCITDDAGKYTLFLKPDAYYMQIACNSINTSFPMKITDDTIDSQDENVSNDGLFNQQYYSINTKNSLIKKRYDDVIEFCGTTKKLVSGRMLDNNNYPLKNAEIIISKNDELVTYIITDNAGRYSFAIDNDTYDIRIRSEKQPIKIIKNFNFIDGKGFMTELKKQSNLLGRDNWLWIYN